MNEWFRMTVQEAMEVQGTPEGGLSGNQARQRLELWGENVIQDTRRLQWWQVFLGQFKDLLVIILIGAGAVSMLTGDPGSAAVIFLVLLMNALLGTIQQQKAQKSLESLKSLSAPEAKVLRQKEIVVIPSSQVVPGDLLLLEAGDMVTADGRLVQVAGLQVNESSLTGESLSAEKELEPPAGAAESVSLGDQTNMVFSGSLVTMGRGIALVTATGMDTQLGRIASMMEGAKEKKTPLQVSLDRFSSRLAAGITVISLLVFAMGIWRGADLLQALMFAVALAVAAIPEALSSIVTIVQAMGTQKMAKEHAVIKDLKAVESLGCVSVICSDKTGTLTQNQMKAEAVYLNQKEYPVSWLEGQKDRKDVQYFLYAAVLNNNASWNASGALGEPTEAALLDMACQAGTVPQKLRERCPRLEEIPFDSRTKVMTVKNQVEGRRVVFVKGALDVLLSRCARISMASEAFPGRKMGGSDRKNILDQNQKWSEHGLRVLALAGGEEGQELTFLGMAAMMDPPRQESKAAVAQAARAGIRTIMITGDHKATAEAIGRKLGIVREGEEALTGSQLNQMEDSQLDEALESVSVYARVSPEHKIRIVEAWQRKGKIVAMTGDGVNDAPALKKADIGIAMGKTGTQVSKDAASMILTDDNFAVIIQAVANGRNVYRNIKNAIQFLLSGNMAGIFCVLYASLRNLPMPFASVQLLFINLLTDSLPAIAIGMEPPEEELLCQPPRDPSKGILTLPFVGTITAQGCLIALAAMTAYHKGLREGGAATAGTMAFSVLTLARLLHGFSCRGRRSIFSLGLMSNPWSLMAFELGAVLLAAVLLIPSLQSMFAAVPLTAGQALAAVSAAVCSFVVIQGVKVLGQFRGDRIC